MNATEARANHEQDGITRKIMAVGAIIMADDGKILVVQETQSKPGIDKMSGDWTFPAETLREGEMPLEGLQRLVKEEIGKIDYELDSQADWIGDYNVGSQENPMWGRVFLLHAKGRSENFGECSAVDGEVVGHQWVYPRWLQGANRRKGVWEPLKDFLTGQRGVVCWKCIPGERG